MEMGGNGASPRNMVVQKKFMGIWWGWGQFILPCHSLSDIAEVPS